MNSRLRRLLTPLLRAVRDGKQPSFRMRSAASQALFLIGKPTAKKQGGRLRREQQRATHKEETGTIWQQLARRADGRCECCNMPENNMNRLELDHWLSGSGRRREKQAVANTWMLCVYCHRQRTRNWPNAADWNEKFREHCARHGYPFTPHIIHAVPAKAGGAP